METKKEHINRIAREWYARNKDRMRQKKLDQCHEYRRQKKVGRPRRVDVPERAERVMVFNPATKELKRVEPPKPKPKQEQEPNPETKIVLGKFLVRFD